MTIRLLDDTILLQIQENAKKILDLIGKYIEEKHLQGKPEEHLIHKCFFNIYSIVPGDFEFTLGDRSFLAEVIKTIDKMTNNGVRLDAFEPNKNETTKKKNTSVLFPSVIGKIYATDELIKQFKSKDKPIEQKTTDEAPNRITTVQCIEIA